MMMMMVMMILVRSPRSQLLASPRNAALQSHSTSSCLQQAAPQAVGIYDFFSSSLPMGYYRRDTAAEELLFTRNTVWFYGAEGTGVKSLELGKAKHQLLGRRYS